jgi:arylsulfatase A-like enzyme
VEPGVTSTFARDWARTSLAGGTLVSLVDALLLQRSRGLFTGGFLAADRLDSTAGLLSFAVLSVLSDAAVAGTLAAIAMFVLRRRVTRRAAMTGALLCGVCPLLVGDVVSYQLARHLGAGFDLGLMFDLTGRSVSEMFAVASAHLIAPALLVVGLVAVVGTVVWLVNRRPGPPLSPPTMRNVLAPAALVVFTIVAFTVAVSSSDALANGLLRKPSGAVLRSAVMIATDVDRDGYGLIGSLSDPDAFNAAVFPYAPDAPGNGVDEDGLAGDLPADAARYPETSTTAGSWVRTPDVVLVLLESFRADLVGAQLDGRAITPVLDALAARGVKAKEAYSHNGYTVQSRYHLLAGTLDAHENAVTLIDDFKRQGYQVGYFSGQDESFGASEYRVGFDRADVAYDARAEVSRRVSTFTTPGSLAVPHQAVQERIAQFVRERGRDTRPLFLYVSLEDTHFPYSHDGIEPIVSDVRLTRGEITPERRDTLYAMYANTAANMDRAIGTVLESVRSARGRDPAVVVTADHGESLYDNAGADFLGHGYALNDIQTAVPLIVANLPMVVPTPFGQIDLRAALNDALRVPVEHATMPLTRPIDRPVFQYLGDLRRPRQIGWVQNGQRFIYDFRTRRVQTRAGMWIDAAALGAADAADFRRLIHEWEWMNLSRQDDSAEP